MGVCWGGPRRYFHIIMNVLARFAYMIHENNVYIYMYMCMYVCMYVCLSVCMYVCMYVCR